MNYGEIEDLKTIEENSQSIDRQLSSKENLGFPQNQGSKQHLRAFNTIQNDQAPLDSQLMPNATPDFIANLDYKEFDNKDLEDIKFSVE